MSIVICYQLVSLRVCSAYRLNIHVWRKFYLFTFALWFYFLLRLFARAKCHRYITIDLFGFFSTDFHFFFLGICDWFVSLLEMFWHPFDWNLGNSMDLVSFFFVLLFLILFCRYFSIFHSDFVCSHKLNLSGSDICCIFPNFYAASTYGRFQNA